MKPLKIRSLLISSTIGFIALLLLTYFAYPFVFKNNAKAMFYFYYYSFVFSIGDENPSAIFSKMTDKSKQIPGHEEGLNYSMILNCTNTAQIRPVSIKYLKNVSSIKLPTQNYAVNLVSIYNTQDESSSLISLIAEIDREQNTCKIIKAYASSMG